MKTIMVYLGLTILILIGAIFVVSQKSNTNSMTTGSSNASIINGTQTVEITAKGGYSPQNITAKANTPTVLNVTTNGTFDCSSALNIPSLGFRKNLPSSGVTQINVPPQPAGTSIKGICAMGMYHFAVNFQ